MINLAQIIQKFSNVENYKVNMSKSLTFTYTNDNQLDKNQKI